MAHHGKRGQGWRHRNVWTTYRPNAKIRYKNIERLHPMSEADFWAVLEECQGAGMKPPTSLAECFSALYYGTFPRKSVIARLRGKSWGGWEAAFSRGNYPGRTWLYDLNKAYRWSACEGLPDMRTAFAVLDDPWDRARYGVYCVLLDDAALPYIRSQYPVWITSEELSRVRTRPLCYYGGVGFRKMVDLRAAFTELDRRFPTATGRVSRAFWGMWNATTGPEQVSWKRGEKSRELPNPFYNPIWALVVTSRIKLRLMEYQPTMLHCFVDSMLSTVEVPTGEAPGEWKLVGTHDAPWIKAPGHWGDRTGPVKQSGVRRTAPGGVA